MSSSDVVANDPAALAPPPSLLVLLRVWFALGLQSFGGGSATLYLIRRTMVEERRWVTAEAFDRDFSLCFLAPGINLLCMTILLGNRLAGFAGSLIALFGLLLPSVSITIVMTALYAQLQQLPALQKALRGIVPATVGLGMMLGANMAQPLLAASRKEGKASLALSIGLLVVCAAVTALFQPPVIAILLGGGAVAAVAGYWRARKGQRHD